MKDERRSCFCAAHPQAQLRPSPAAREKQVRAVNPSLPESVAIDGCIAAVLCKCVAQAGRCWYTAAVLTAEDIF